MKAFSIPSQDTPPEAFKLEYDFCKKIIRSVKFEAMSKEKEIVIAL